MWIWVSLTYATFRLECNSFGVVTEPAPIAKWTKGKHYKKCIQYWEDKKVLLRFEVFK